MSGVGSPASGGGGGPGSAGPSTPRSMMTGSNPTTPAPGPGTPGAAGPGAGPSDPTRLYQSIPILVQKARDGTLPLPAIMQLRTFLLNHKTSIIAFFAKQGLPDPYHDLPDSIDPAKPPPTGPSTPGAKQNGVNLPPPAPAAKPIPSQRPPAVGRPPGPSVPSAPVARTEKAAPSEPPGPTSTDDVGQSGKVATTAATPPTPAAVTPTATQTTAAPKIGWPEVFKMSEAERKEWFRNVPGAEAAFNGIVAKAHASALAKKNAAQATQAGQPPGSASNENPSAVGTNTTVDGSAKGLSGKSESRTAPTKTKNAPGKLELPPPPTASFSTSSATTPRSTGNTPRPALDKDKIAFYAGLSEAQGNSLPVAERTVWLNVRRLIEAQRRTAAIRAQEQTQQGPNSVSGSSGETTPLSSAPILSKGGVTPGTLATAATISDPSNKTQALPPPEKAPILSQSALIEEISRLRQLPEGITLARLKEVCARAGQAWTSELELKLAEFAVDGGPLLVAAGLRPAKSTPPALSPATSAKVPEPIAREPTPPPPSPPRRTPSPPPKSSREIAQENVRAMYEEVTGYEITGFEEEMFTNLAEDLFTDVVKGGCKVAALKNEQPVLDARDVAYHALKTHDVFLVGFGVDLPGRTQYPESTLKRVARGRAAAASHEEIERTKRLKAVHEARSRDAK